MDIKELRRKAMQLPLTPGVYLMKNTKGEIIYVGKAKALKNRVSEGMILSAEDKDGRLVLLTPSQVVASGCSVG